MYLSIWSFAAFFRPLLGNRVENWTRTTVSALRRMFPLTLQTPRFHVRDSTPRPEGRLGSLIRFAFSDHVLRTLPL